MPSTCYKRQAHKREGSEAQDTCILGLTLTCLKGDEKPTLPSCISTCRSLSSAPGADFPVGTVSIPMIDAHFLHGTSKSVEDSGLAHS